MTGNKQTHKRLASYALSLMILIIIGSVVGGCGLEDSQEKGSNTVVKTFTATFSSMTKTSLSADATVSWDKYDQVKYYSADGARFSNIP